MNDERELTEKIIQKHDGENNLSNSQCTSLVVFLSIIGVLSVIAFVLAVILISTRTTPDTQVSKEIVILHFSDFYQIEGIPANSTDTGLGLGGLARLATIVKSQTKPTIITFGGDLFSPSSMTTFLGAPNQMIDGFNKLSQLAPLVAVVGNHEFDNVKMASTYFQRCNFTWLLANFYEANTTNLINGTKAVYVISLGDIKIGFIGIAFDYRTVTLLTSSEATFEDPLATTQQWVRKLRAEGVDFIVVLSHMPLADERVLLQNVLGVDLCLTGHDHEFVHEVDNGVTLVEGDINLSTLSVISISYYPGTSPLIRQVLVDNIVPDNSIPKDVDIQNLVNFWISKFDDSALTVIGKANVTLHASKVSTRVKETNVGNFVCDSVEEWAKTALVSKPNTEDVPVVTFINSGTLRWTTDIAAGMNLTKRNILDLLPFGDVAIVINTTGSILRKALENGVSKIPAPDGRFLQVGGFKFVYACQLNEVNECSIPSGSRVLNMTLNNGTPIVDTTELFIVCTDYDAEGGDENTFLVGLEQIIDSESAKTLFDILVGKIEQLGVISPIEDGRIIQK